ncbi:MAG: YhfC family intramembrane metalloprotease [Tannerella sp.]|nr:YhfC family intramembrane metalloprotease [Tannerella sp.]
MVTSAIISIGLPIGLFFVFHKGYGLKIIPLFMGVAGFIIFALILERSIHLIVFSKFALREKPIVYILYGIFMAGIFEETSRFICFKILKKKYNGIMTALAHGIGHGGIESIIIGLSMVNAVIFSVMLNTGNIETITANLQGEALEQVNAQVAALLTAPSYSFSISGIERIFAIAIQISLSVIVYYSVYGNNTLWLYPFAIIVHAIVDIPAAALQTGIVKDVNTVELLVCISAIILMIIAKKIHGKLKKNITEAIPELG